MRRTGTVIEDQLGRFLHDLRQLINAGLLLSGHAVNSGRDSDVEACLATIHAVFEQLNLLVDAEAGGGSPRRTRVDLSGIVGACVQVARRGNTEITTWYSPRATAVGDPTLLRRAVANVLDNAVRATGNGGTVSVHVSVAGDDSIIEVSDDGIGFGRGPRGTGQGMSVVALAVAACQGRLEIATGPSPGTTVRMVLPRHGAAS
jgi:signal transduction histidine kinase